MALVPDGMCRCCWLTDNMLCAECWETCTPDMTSAVFGDKGRD